MQTSVGDFNKVILKPAHLSAIDHVFNGPCTVTGLACSAEQSDIFRIDGPGGPLGIVKAHHHRLSAIREMTAYTAWAGAILPWTVPFFGSLPGAPELLAMGYAPGIETDNHKETIWFEAGRMLRSLHALHIVDDDTLPLHAAFVQRLKRLQGQGQFCLGEKRWSRICAIGMPAKDTRRVPCHRDFRPRNWRCQTQRPSLCVIDFGQSQLDDPMTDLATVWPQLRRCPARCDAFFTGYGVKLTPPYRRRLDALVCIRAVASIEWGQRHGLSRSAREGQALLARLSDLV